MEKSAPRLYSIHLSVPYCYDVLENSDAKISIQTPVVCFIYTLRYSLASYEGSESLFLKMPLQAKSARVGKGSERCCYNAFPITDRHSPDCQNA